MSKKLVPADQEKLTANEVLGAIRVINQVFGIDARERIKRILRKVEELRPVLSGCFQTLLNSTDQSRLHAILRRTTAQLSRCSKLYNEAKTDERRGAILRVIEGLSETNAAGISLGIDDLEISIHNLKIASVVKDAALLPLIKYWERRSGADAPSVGVDVVLTALGMAPGLGTLMSLISVGRMAKELYDEPQDLREAASRMTLVLAAEFAITLHDSGQLSSAQKAAEEWRLSRPELQKDLDALCDRIEPSVIKAEALT